MEHKKQQRSQAEMQKELRLLIEYVKAYHKSRGKKMTQGDMGLMMGKSDKYLTHLLGGHEDIKEEHLVLFKNKFKKELPSDDPNKLDLDNIHAALEVLQRKMAEIQEKFPDGESAKSYLEKLRKEIELVSIQRQDA